MGKKKKLLTAKQQRDIDYYVQAYPEFYRTAEQTIWERLAQLDAGITPDALNQTRQYPRFSKLTDAELYIVNFSDFGGDLNLLRDAILRRFIRAAPLELALHVSLWTRTYWVFVQINANEKWEELFRPILQAVCARDFVAATKLSELTTPIIARPKNRAYASVFLGVSGLIRKDPKLLEQAVEKERKSDPSYVKAIRGVLRAVADNSAADFAEQMNKVLSAYRRYMFDDELYGLFDPHAQGLFELSRRYNPEVVSSFDVDRKLPWDREYFEWSQEIDDVSKYFDIDAIPDRIKPFILDFTPIPWAATVRENWVQ